MKRSPKAIYQFHQCRGAGANLRRSVKEQEHVICKCNVRDLYLGRRLRVGPAPAIGTIVPQAIRGVMSNPEFQASRPDLILPLVHGRCHSKLEYMESKSNQSIWSVVRDMRYGIVVQNIQSSTASTTGSAATVAVQLQ